VNHWETFSIFNSMLTFYFANFLFVDDGGSFPRVSATIAVVAVNIGYIIALIALLLSTTENKHVRNAGGKRLARLRAYVTAERQVQEQMSGVRRRIRADTEREFARGDNMTSNLLDNGDAEAMELPYWPDKCDVGADGLVDGGEHGHSRTESRHVRVDHVDSVGSDMFDVPEASSALRHVRGFRVASDRTDEMMELTMAPATPRRSMMDVKEEA
jgi:hypothetical protein